MRRFALPLFLLAACEQQAPPSPPPVTPVAETKPAPAPAAEPAVPAEAPSTAPAAELNAGKALSLNPHPAAAEGAAKEEKPAPPSELEDPYVAAMVRAIEARKKGDARAAEVEYRAALKAQPRDANALAGVAEMLFAQEKNDDAVSPAELAYELKPTDPEVRWVFGLVMLSKNKRADDAIAAWEALIKDSPDYAKQLGVAERLKVIKTYTKGAPHGGVKPTAGPSSQPASAPAK